MLCDDKLPEGWYRFVGAAGTKMPTTRVPAYRCGTIYSGWLHDPHPTVEDGDVFRRVCFTGKGGSCKDTLLTSVKNCGSYYIYKLFRPPSFAILWYGLKCTLRNKRIHYPIRR